MELFELLGETPIIQASNIQTEMAVSAMEDEHIALEHNTRELLLLHRVIEKLTAALILDCKYFSMVFTIWEDNNGVLVLANNPTSRMFSWSKNTSLNHHFFHSWIYRRAIFVRPIDTKEHKADILTRILGEIAFGEKREFF